MARASGGLEKATRFSPDSSCVTMPLSRFLARRIVTHQTSEAMHIQGNHDQSDRVGKSV